MNSMELEFFEGMEVTFNDLLTETKWEFPKEKFVEYDETDLWWAVKYGYGKWVTLPSKTCYRVANRLIIHPETWKEVKKEIDRRNKEIEKLYTS